MKVTVSNLLIIFLVSFSATVFSQEKVNQLDAQGKRTGIWKKYYNNKRIRYEGTFEAGKEVGTFKFYSEVSSNYPVIIKEFSSNSNIAKVSFYTVKGILLSKGEMNGKNRVGMWLYFHDDGKTLMSEENYENGVLNGSSTTYYKSGKVTETKFYKEGKLHGNLKRFSSDGILLDDVFYEEGKLNGPAKYYNSKGKLILSGDYKDDLKVGEWVNFKDED